MVDNSYTTLHKRTGEGGWLATLSTPLVQPLEMNAVCMAYNNIINGLTGADPEILHGRWLMGWLSIVNYTGARGVAG